MDRNDQVPKNAKKFFRKVPKNDVSPICFSLATIGACGGRHTEIRLNQVELGLLRSAGEEGPTLAVVDLMWPEMD